MDRKVARNIIINTFENSFNKERFILFLRIGKYTDNKNEIDLLIVQLKRETSLERARTMQRNFIAWYLKGSRSGKLKDAALVAFVSPDNNEDWRFSLVKLDYRFEEATSGRIKVKEEFTPAKRWSFLVGKNEKSHTAQSRLLPILEKDDFPTLEDLEKVFDVEVVTKEFFEKYRDLFIRTKLQLDEIVKNNPKVQQEFQNKNINTVDFAKKLLGQIVFLYFLQKKGWFGVEKEKRWGTGPKDFIRRLFNKEFGGYENFYNDILEPLFYEALRTDRSADDHYYSRFNCKIPFLNGGLFDPQNNFDWVDIDILFMYDYKTKMIIPGIKELTLSIIERLNREGIRVTTLTKGVYPEELLDKRRFLETNEYGITLVSLNDDFKSKFEPYSAPYEERIAALKKLADNGLKTWVSIEPYPTPILDPQSGDIERILNKIKFVKKIIFGKLNYRRLAEYNNSNYAWKNNEQFYKEMAQKLIEFCIKNDIKYHIKIGPPLSKDESTNIFIYEF